MHTIGNCDRPATPDMTLSFDKDLRLFDLPAGGCPRPRLPRQVGLHTFVERMHSRTVLSGRGSESAMVHGFQRLLHHSRRKRCDPFTITDAHSRYLIRCQIVSHADLSQGPSDFAKQPCEGTGFARKL